MTENHKEENSIYWRLAKANVFDCAPIVEALKRDKQQKGKNDDHDNHETGNEYSSSLTKTTPLSTDQINTFYAACVTSFIHKDIYESKKYINHNNNNNNNNNPSNNQNTDYETTDYHIISCLPSVEELQRAAKGFYSKEMTARLERRIVHCFENDGDTQDAASLMSRYQLDQSRSLNKYADLVHRFSKEQKHQEHNNNNTINNVNNNNNNNNSDIIQDVIDTDANQQTDNDIQTMFDNNSDSLHPHHIQCQDEKNLYRNCIQSAVTDRLSTEATRNRCFAERLKYETCQLSISCATPLMSCMHHLQHQQKQQKQHYFAAVSFEQCLKIDPAVQQCILNTKEQPDQDTNQ